MFESLQKNLSIDNLTLSKYRVAIDEDVAIFLILYLDIF